MDDLDELAECIGYAREIVKSHVPPNQGPGRTRCPICDAWYPCDLISLAALAVLKDDALAAAQARITTLTAALQAEQVKYDHIAACDACLTPDEDGESSWCVHALGLQIDADELRTTVLAAASTSQEAADL